MAWRHGVQGNMPLVRPDGQRLQRCRSRGLVLVTGDEAEVVPVSTSMSADWHADCAPIMAIARRALSPYPGRTVDFCGNRPAEIKNGQRGFKLYFFKKTFLLALRRRRRDYLSRAETGRTCYMPLASLPVPPYSKQTHSYS
jgi:hypothetical protein